MIRPIVVSEIAPFAAAVAGQELLRRYGTTSESLTTSLSRALERGESLLVVDEAGRVSGLAWFLRTGTFAFGGYLRLIALAPGSEGKGLGARLLRAVEDEVRKTSEDLFLLVSHFNEGAQRFYGRHGFREVGRLSEIIKPNIDEIILWKRLS